MFKTRVNANIKVGEKLSESDIKDIEDISNITKELYIHNKKWYRNFRSLLQWKNRIYD